MSKSTAGLVLAIIGAQAFRGPARRRAGATAIPWTIYINRRVPVLGVRFILAQIEKLFPQKNQPSPLFVVAL